MSLILDSHWFPATEAAALCSLCQLIITITHSSLFFIMQLFVHIYLSFICFVFFLSFAGVQPFRQLFHSPQLPLELFHLLRDEQAVPGDLQATFHGSGHAGRA